MIRVISGIVMGLMAVALLAWGSVTVIQSVVLVLAMLAAYELHKLMFTKEKGIDLWLYLLMAGVGLYVIFFHFSSLYVLSWTYLVIAMALIFPMFDKEFSQVERSVSGMKIMGSQFYLVLGFSGFAMLQTLPHKNYWVLLVMLCTYMGDTFAYFFGKTWGKEKWVPHISPGKTKMGFYGAMLGGVVGALLTQFFYGEVLNSWILLIPVGLVTSVLGAYGDLAESVMKRAAGQKDSGQLIPGHGGIMDRLDSLLLTSPFVYLLANWLV
jgi:phosphatidate cytidylyltransferase